MNVIVANKNQGLLNTLDVDVIKTINGEFSVDEIISTFSNFFFNRMFLDITAIKAYKNIDNIQKLSMNLEVEKIIFLMDNEIMNDNAYLSKLISMGIYNFATNKESLMYLYNHPNTYKDVAHIQQLGNNGSQESVNKERATGPIIKEEKLPPINAKVIGFKNLTSGAGATTLIYMIKRTMTLKDYVVAIEVNKNDFGYFGEKDMYSVKETNLIAAITKFGNAATILIDLNNCDGKMCNEIVYLMEPGIIKLNKLMDRNANLLETLYDKKIVLNKSMLSDRDVEDFEFESHLSVAYNVPPLNDRDNNEAKLEELIKIIID